MKIIKQPTTEGTEWWVIVHDLIVKAWGCFDIRPINLFNGVCHLAFSSEKSAGTCFNLSTALENKLFAVWHYRLELNKAISEWNDPIYLGQFVRDYKDQQKVLCAIETQLYSIYSTLEICAQINRLFYPIFPMGFREQAEKYDLFSFSNNPWLPIFYDLRTELTHFGTAIPQMSKSSLMIEIQRPGRKFALNKGRWEISFRDILGFPVILFSMLDKWAQKEIVRVDQNKEIDLFEAVGPNERLNARKISIKELINKFFPVSKEEKEPE